MVADGIKTYIIIAYIVITARILSFVVGIIGFGVMLVGLVSLVARIIMIVSQFKIANGMLMVFGGTSLGNYSTEPTPVQAVTTPLQGSGSSSKFCSKRGGKLLPDAKFCPSCGQTIK